MMKKHFLLWVVVLAVIVGSFKGYINTIKFPEPTETEEGVGQTLLNNAFDILKKELQKLLNNSGIEFPILNGKTETGAQEGTVNGLECVTCASVVDGDTMYVNTQSGEQIKVRLIGVDTPESVHSDGDKNTIWGTYASDYTKSLVSSGDVLYLEYDKEREDIYGRTLAYVYFSDNKQLSNMLNYKLVSEGYATAVTYGKNKSYKNSFQTAFNLAKEQKKGLWQYEEFGLWE